MKSGLTIQELAAEILRQKDSKEDYIVNTKNLQMELSGSDVVLRVLDENVGDRIEPLETQTGLVQNTPSSFLYLSGSLRPQIEGCRKIGTALFVDEISANIRGYELLYRASKFGG